MFTNRKIARFVFSLVVLASLFFTSLGITPVYAASIVVNTNEDSLENDGFCTLREAITNANGDSQLYATPGDCATGIGTDTITFAGNYTITLFAQLPAVTSTIIINGNGAANTIIQANASPNTATYRVFAVIGSTGDLTLDSLTVRHGVCIGCDGGGISIDSGASLTVTNSTISGNYALYGGGISNYQSTMTVTNSTLTGNSADGFGGGLYNFHHGTVTVTNSTLSGNSAYYGGGISNDTNCTVTVTNSTLSRNSTSYGGGIYNNGSNLTVTNSTISENSAGYLGGGVANVDGIVTVTNSTLFGNSAFTAGGIYNNHSVTVTNSTLDGNGADDLGGGIYNNGIVTVTNSTLSENFAFTAGGIYNNNLVTVTNSTLSRNSAYNDGGGGNYNDNNGGGIYNNYSVTVTNSTLSDNSAYNDGGGVFNEANGTVTVTNSTLSGNSAFNNGGGIYSDGSAWIHNSSIVFNTLVEGTDEGAAGIYGSAALYNSIVAGNIHLLSSTYQDCSGTIHLLEGRNLFSNTTSTSNCTFSGGSGTWDILNSLSLLGPLQNNGGPTQTHALLPGSNAIDRGRNAVCAALPVDNIDQRGVTRPQGSQCDVGAFELETSSDTVPPLVISIARADPNPTNSTSVNFLVTFSESVSGVDAADFNLTSSEVVNAAISGVTGADAEYTVTVDTGSGHGTIRLDVIDDDSIIDAQGNPLGGTGPGNGNFSSGEVYDIEKNEAPTDILLSASTISENLPAGTTVGTLASIDPDPGDTHTYSFCGSADEAYFSLAGDALNTAAILDFEVQSTFNTCIRATDAGGMSFDEEFEILLLDAAENAPPETTIIAMKVKKPQGISRYMFIFTSSISDSMFMCRLDQETFSPCKSPTNYSGLSAGLYTFQVYAIDQSGNPDLTPAEYSFTVNE